MERRKAAIGQSFRTDDRPRRMPELVIAQGSLVLIFAALVAVGIGAPLSEDVVLLTAGAIAFKGLAPLPIVIAVCLTGVLIGDALLFLTAKKLGGAALRSSIADRFLPVQSQEKIRRLFQSRGGLLVFAARYVAGVRAPVFAMAGAHGMRLKRFLLWDALALCISGPLMIGIGYFCAERLASLAPEIVGTQRTIAAVAVTVAAVALTSVVLIRRRNRTAR